MKQSSAIAHVRQLCCLGISFEALAPELIKALHFVIPSISGTFNWVGENGESSRVYIENPIASAMELFVNESERILSDPRTSLIERAAASSSPAGSFIYLREQGFYQTDMYNLICRPHNLHYALEGIVRCNGQVVGALTLWRSRDDRNFNDKNKNVMLQLLPYFSLASSPITKTTRDHNPTQSDGSGMIILDNKGRVQHLCKTAKEYLLQATHPFFHYSTPKTHANIDVNQAIVELGKKITAIFQGKNYGVPVHSVRSPLGTFVFRGYCLDGAFGVSEQAIGVIVEKRVSKHLKIMENMRKLELSPKQSEIALLVASGYSNHEIGTHISVSVNTVRDHLDKIYNKLDINGRQELVNRLA